MTVPNLPIPTRDRDIAGRRFPPPASSAGAVLQIRPPQFEPPDNAREFLLNFSLIAAAGAKTALFTLDAQQNPVAPSAALQLPPSTQARISAVAIGGDTGVTPGTPILTFQIAADRAGQSALPGWEAVALPGRGGIVAAGFAPFTRITNEGSFIGGFVTNVDANPRYAEMTIMGWFWTT